MKAVLLCVLALVLATVASAAADFCVVDATQPNGVKERVNLTALAPYHNPVLRAGGAVFDVYFSACKELSKPAGTNCSGYAYVSRGTSRTCFSAPPMNSLNGTTNTTDLTYKGEVMQNSLLFLKLRAGVSAVTTLDAKFHCGGTAGTTMPELIDATLAGQKMTLSFRTHLACPRYAPADTPAPTPVDEGKKDNGISTWAIVGIIAGAVVFVVVVAFVVFKCRGTSEAAEGEYSRV